jgi:hypothetical protein
VCSPNCIGQTSHAAHDAQNVVVRRVHGHLRTLRHLSELELKSGVINAGHVARAGLGCSGLSAKGMLIPTAGMLV